MEQDKDSQPRYSAAMGMYIKDFDRYHLLLLQADSFAIDVKTGETAAIKKWWALLDQIFINWRPLILMNDKKEEAEIEILLSACESLILTGAVQDSGGQKLDVLVKNLRDIHKRLMLQKQYINLGIRMEKNRKTSNKERIEDAFKF